MKKDHISWVKRHYIRPALIECETYFFNEEERKSLFPARGCSFEIATTIWTDQLLDEYRIRIPSCNVFDGNGKAVADIVEMKVVTYVPTGKVVYDNHPQEPKGLVYEYILETLLGKKDLIKL